MKDTTAQGLVVPATTSQDVLTEILRDAAQRLLGQAIEAEVQGWLEFHKHIVDENSHRQVVGNGRLPTRTIVTGVGPVEVSQRRVHDRRIVGENDHGEPIDVNGRTIVGASQECTQASVHTAITRKSLSGSGFAETRR